MEPKWMKRPSCPGIWLCQRSNRLNSPYRWTGLDLTQDDIDRGAPFATDIVYGPIPEPKEEDNGEA